MHNLGMNDGLFFCLGLCCLRLTLVEREDDEERGGDNLSFASEVAEQQHRQHAHYLALALCPLISISMTKRRLWLRAWKHPQRLE